MDNNYIYSGTRAKVLERSLLSENQKELLVGAKSVSEMFKVLHDTYVAPFLGKEDPDSITEALDRSIAHTKTILKKISPKPEILDILWIKYDFYNLKTIIKAERAGLQKNETLELCYIAGMYTPEELFKAFETKTLSSLQKTFEEAVFAVEKTTEVFEVDRIMSQYYFKTICSLAKKSKDSFVKDFVILLVDMYNIKAGLRVNLIPGLEEKHVFIEGGTFTEKDLETKEKTLNQLKKRFGGNGRWTKIIENFNGERYVDLEKELDQCEIDFLKRESLVPFSSASLFSYFKAQKNNAQIIGTILASKRSGMKEKELREVLRRSYTA